MSSAEKPPKQKETVAQEIAEGKVDSIETSARYLAYANRLRTIALATSRYLAYTSGYSLIAHLTSRRRRGLQKCYSSVGRTYCLWSFMGLCPYRRKL